MAATTRRRACPARLVRRAGRPSTGSRTHPSAAGQPCHRVRRPAPTPPPAVALLTDRSDRRIRDPGSGRTAAAAAARWSCPSPATPHRRCWPSPSLPERRLRRRLPRRRAQGRTAHRTAVSTVPGPPTTVPPVRPARPSHGWGRPTGVRRCRGPNPGRPRSRTARRVRRTGSAGPPGAVRGTPRFTLPPRTARPARRPVARQAVPGPAGRSVLPVSQWTAARPVGSTARIVGPTARPVALTARPAALMARPEVLTARPEALTACPAALTARSVALMAVRGAARRRDRVPPVVPPGCPPHRRSSPGGATARHRSFRAAVTATGPAPTAGTTRGRMPDPVPPVDRAERPRSTGRCGLARRPPHHGSGRAVRCGTGRTWAGAGEPDRATARHLDRAGRPHRAGWAPARTTWVRMTWVPVRIGWAGTA
jgi:hypothetical protein